MKERPLTYSQNSDPPGLARVLPGLCPGIRFVLSCLLADPLVCMNIPDFPLSSLKTAASFYLFIYFLLNSCISTLFQVSCGFTFTTALETLFLRPMSPSAYSHPGSTSTHPQGYLTDLLTGPHPNSLFLPVGISLHWLSLAAPAQGTLAYTRLGLLMLDGKALQSEG